MTLEQLIKQEKELVARLSENRAMQRELNMRTFVREINEKYGLSIGEEVEWKMGDKVMRGILSNIVLDSSGRLSYYVVRLFNSDGRVGKRTTKICGFIHTHLLKVASKPKP